MFIRSLPFIVLMVLHSQVMAEPQFTATDITSWTNAQLQTLPYFDNYVPFDPVGAVPSFNGLARSGDIYVGTYDGYYGDYAARIDRGVQSNYEPLGTYYWHYTTCDSTDCHFYNGRVGYSHFYDVNSSGAAVGDSTLAGSGSSAIDHVSHAVRTDVDTGDLVDLTPTADRAAATGINNAGEIVGWQQAGGPTEGFRMGPDGNMVTLNHFGSSVTPTAINELGRVVGEAIDTSISYFNPRAFVSDSGAAIQQLALPQQGGVEFSTTTDLNNLGWITGYSWKAAAPSERLASLWIEEANDQWAPYDLNELTDGGDFILQRALAVNDYGHLLVQGKLDEDFSPTHYYLLTPETLLTPRDRTSGDYDDDDDVDGADFLQWQRSFGASDYFPAYGINADGNNDGTVNAADLIVWEVNFGNSAIAASNLATVPEPESLCLMGITGLLMLKIHFFAHRAKQIQGNKS